MRNFTNVNDIGDLKAAVKEALEVKANRFGYKHLGENKTLLMIFFNSSLRTRLSTQKRSHEPRHERNRSRREPRSMET